MNWVSDPTDSVLSLRHLSLCECFLDVFFDLIPRLQTEYLIHHFAVATDIKRGRQELQSAISVAYRVLADQNRIIHPEVVGKLFRIHNTRNGNQRWNNDRQRVNRGILGSNKYSVIPEMRKPNSLAVDRL